jgi:hypothetical protein
MRLTILQGLLCLALLASFANAQQENAVAAQVQNTSASQSKDSQAIVYVYRRQSERHAAGGSDNPVMEEWSANPEGSSFASSPNPLSATWQRHGRA